MRPIPPSLLQLFFILAIAFLAGTPSSGQEARAKGSSEASPSGAPADPTLEALIEAHNKIRAEEKLPPLKAQAQLTVAARNQARDMAEHKQLTHEGSDGSNPGTRIKRTGYVFKGYGENVAQGQETVADAMRAWIESPPHRKNILGDFTEMGAAVVKDSDGQDFWCVDFGRPMPKVDPARSPVEMIAALNKARADAKKLPLKEDVQLSRIAGVFVRQAATRKVLDGKDGDGKTPFDVLKSEGYRGRRFAMTLATGEGDPGKVLAAWLERPEDRDTLLSNFDRAGVGVSTDAEGVPYWVILLAQRSGR